MNSEVEYCGIGKKNSLLAPDGNQDLMKKIFGLYTRYQECLAREKLIDPDLFKPSRLKPYHCVIVDEAQDLSPCTLQALYDSAEGNQIATCLDTHQSLASSKSVLPFLESLIPNHVKLDLSHRFGKNITALGNAIIKVKNNLTGGVANKNELTSIELPTDQNRPADRVQWLNLKEKSSWEAVVNEYKKTAVAIVATSEHLEETKKLFPDTPLIFTPEQIKGLEYKLIVAYRPLDQQIFHDANKRLRVMSHLKEVTARTKGQTAEQYRLPFNILFTTMTRAMDGVVILQDSKHETQILMDTLKKESGYQESVTKSTVTPTAAPGATQAEWCEQVVKLLESGNESQAREIYLKKLNFTERDFKAFKSKIFDKAHPSLNEATSSTNVVDFNHKKPSRALVNRFTTSHPANAVSSEGKHPLNLKNNSESSGTIKADKKESPETNAKKDIVEYVHQFEKNITVSNLSRLLKIKAKDLNKILFEIPTQISGGLYGLFHTLFAGTSGQTDVLAAALRENESHINEKINVEKFRATLTGMTTIAIKKDAKVSKMRLPLIFMAAFDMRPLSPIFPTIFKAITANDLIFYLKKTCGDVEKRENTSVLYLLLEKDENLPFLIELLKARPDIAKGICTEDLTRYLPSSSRNWENKSVLLHCARDLMRIGILSHLFDLNPKLTKGFCAADLIRCTPIQYISKENALEAAPPLYSFARCPEGRRILTLIFKNSSNVLAKLTEENFKRSPVRLTGKLKNTSPLSLLQESPDAEELLSLIYQAKPRLKPGKAEATTSVQDSSSSSAVAVGAARVSQQGIFKMDEQKKKDEAVTPSVPCDSNSVEAKSGMDSPTV